MFVKQKNIIKFCGDKNMNKFGLIALPYKKVIE